MSVSAGEDLPTVPDQHGFDSPTGFVRWWDQDLTFPIRGVAHQRLMIQREPVKPVPQTKRSSGERAKERRMTLLDDQSS